MFALVGAIPVTGCFANGRDALNVPGCMEFKSSGKTTLRTRTPSDEIRLLSAAIIMRSDEWRARLKAT